MNRKLSSEGVDHDLDSGDVVLLGTTSIKVADS